MPPPAVDVAIRTSCLLGEGPIWIAREQALYFVDIKGGSVLRWHPDSLDLSVADVGGCPSFVVPASGGQLLVGSRDAIHFFADGRMERLVTSIPHPVQNRTNDATVDGRGRLWFGTMDDTEVSPTGRIWCFDGADLRVAGGAAIVTNGPAVDDERGVLYHADTLRRIVWRCALTDSPTLADDEVFVQLAEGDGYPDGLTVDSEGCLWVALWDGGAVRRYAPDGTLLMHVPLPVARVTKVAFGGAKLDIAFVTTARVGLSESALAHQPLAGCVFAFSAPAPGRLPAEVRLR